MENRVEDVAEEVHEILGVGHTESVYHSALEKEFSERGISFSSEAYIPILYKGMPVGYKRADFILDPSYDGVFLVEIKQSSNGGKSQLQQYKNLVGTLTDYGEVKGAFLIQFNSNLNFIEV